MNCAKLLVFCVLGLAITSCRKNSETSEKELQEAGYNMTSLAWFAAIASNDLVALQKMRAAGFDSQAQDAEGNRGLHAAAISGHNSVAEYLLKIGLQINEKGALGRTPLMSAVIARKPKMVKWLLTQGADPKQKDKAGYQAMMLAVSEGGEACVEELAPYYSDELDSALLLAALKGKAEEIDALTNYGASVYTQMEDGRTPLMLAAQNGHQDAVQMLMDIGASRFAKTESGETAYSMAAAAGHTELARQIEQGFVRDQLALDADEEIAAELENELNEQAIKQEIEVAGMYGQVAKTTDLPLSSPASSQKITSLEGAQVNAKGSVSSEKFTVSPPPAGAPPLVMRSYRQRELPVQVSQVSAGTATLRLAGTISREIQVKAGQMIPGSKISVVRIFRKVEIGKLNNSQPLEYGVLEVFDHDTGRGSEWIEGRPAASHEAVAMVEDYVNGRRYIAKPGQKFTSLDGREFIVNDVRPSQIVIEELSSGEVNTLRLRGPKG